MKSSYKVIFSSVIASIAIVSVVYAFVVSVPPIAKGFYVQLTKSNNALQNFQHVDEVNCNGNQDFMFTNVVGNKDSYVVSLNDIPNGSLITSITIVSCASKISASITTSTIGIFYRYNGVDSFEHITSLNNVGTVPVVLQPTLFNNVNLIKEATSSLEIGIDYWGGGGGTAGAGVKLSQIYAKIAY